MSRPTLTVISPVYNESEVIEEFLQALVAQLGLLESTYDTSILLVVDRCTDNTLEILKRFAESTPNLKVLALSARFGHQLSLLAGIDYATSDAIVMMDCDMQHPPELIPELVKRYEEGCDVVYTVRTYPKSVGLLKRLTSSLFYRLLHYLSTVPIHDGAADFRLISRRVAAVIRESVRERNLFLRGLISWMGFAQGCVRFQAQRRSAGQSKYAFGRMLRFGMHAVVSFSRKPLQAAISAGMVFAFIGLAQAVVAVVQYLYYDYLPAGWTTIVVLLSFFSGVQLIFLGIIGEYVGSIFDEVKRRPLYIVDEMINFESEVKSAGAAAAPAR
ncbi:MAG: glycosyltransferase family 2 protein [Armatimonadetes bacterium]|nr:glycosyltransferase family 2 protein [Armatimonadota bacterium]